MGKFGEFCQHRHTVNIYICVSLRLVLRREYPWEVLGTLNCLCGPNIGILHELSAYISGIGGKWLCATGKRDLGPIKIRSIRAQELDDFMHLFNAPPKSTHIVSRSLWWKWPSFFIPWTIQHQCCYNSNKFVTHVRRFGIDSNDFCRCCGDDEKVESVEHLLCSCSALSGDGWWI